MAVERFELRKRALLADGATFGAHGPYERIEGELVYAVDPRDPRNARIVDLGLAPRDADGLVRFRGRLSVLRPANPGAGNGTLLLDVPNRGRRLVLGSFNRVSAAAALLNPLDPGDGHLFAEGYTLATVGWQWDVGRDAGFWCEVPMALQDGAPICGDVVAQLRPDRASRWMHIGQLGAAPYVPCDLGQPDARLYRVDERTRVLTPIARAAWRFARELPGEGGEAGEVVADGSHVWLRDGFTPGALYLLVFRAEGAPVVGCGLLAVRDAAEWLRDGPFGAHARVLGFGVSQTGRFLRQFLHEGLNRSAQGGRVFDGVWIHIAGAQRGDFNHRFAQPSAAGAPSFGQCFPFAMQPTRDALGGEGARVGGLGDRCRAAGVLPRIVITNTSWEYWRGDAALAHVGTDDADLPEDPDVRIYAFAGTQHVGAVFPPSRSIEITRARYPFSVVDFSPLMRATLHNLAAWVAHDVPPPPSRHPRIADGSAATPSEVLARFAHWPDLVRVDPEKLSRLRALTLDPDAGHADYPVPEGAAYPMRVSAVDDDGNEVAGIHLPDVACPVGTHTGWNPRDPRDGGEDIATIFAGFTRFLAPDEDARARAGDPRPSIASRYASREDYEARVRAVAESLVRQRHLRAEDVDWVVHNCLARHDVAVSGD